MAEILIKIDTAGQNPAYQDGDIVSAFNQRRIRQMHAQNISNIRNFGFTNDGRRPDSLAKSFFEHTRRYRIERISGTEIRQTEIATGLTETFSNTPNAKGEYINVPLYLERRLKHGGHVIFGTPGNEVWYGGRCDYSNAKMTLVWNDIEAQTPNREVDFQLCPLGHQDLRSFLAIQVNDFTDADKEALVSPELVQVGTEPVLGGPLFEIAKKRRFSVRWRTIGFPELPAQVRNKNLPIDRREIQFTRANIVILKPSNS